MNLSLKEIHSTVLPMETRFPFQYGIASDRQHDGLAHLILRATVEIGGGTRATDGEILEKGDPFMDSNGARLLRVLSKTMKLQQGQIWKKGDDYYRVVEWSRMAIGYKLMKDPETREGTFREVSKKEFCRLIKGAELLGPNE